VKTVPQRFWIAEYDRIRFYNHHTIKGAMHAVFKFPNGLGVSIITHSAKQFEAAKITMKGKGWSVSDDVRHGLSRVDLMTFIGDTMSEVTA
jgi:hypothetical protein